MRDYLPSFQEGLCTVEMIRTTIDSYGVQHVKGVNNEAARMVIFHVIHLDIRSNLLRIQIEVIIA